MFHQRSSAFDRNISALEGRLHALENEIEKLGRKAGRRTSAGVSAAGDQIGDAIAVAVNEIVDRFRSGRRVAGDEAVRLGNEAAKFGAKVGNDALERVASEVERRPLVTLAVAIGIGILIGMAGAATRRG
ncbi:MAG TPA: hypothetical protein VGL31_17075 [Xanthobacteraceae bacterium]|jgi:ElaB/YqjD/DUF883 family membrane-anchored ribosome-binding protein